MAITSRGYTKGTVTGSASSFTPAIFSGSGSITGVSSGDVAILHITLRSGTALSAPTGWTQVPNCNTNVASIYQSAAFYRVCTGSDTNPTVTISLANKTGLAWECGIYIGVDNTTPIDASNFDSSSSNTTSIPVPSISPTGSTDMLVMLAGSDISSATYSSPTLGTIREQGVTSTTNNSSGVYWDALLSSSGATGIQHITVSPTETYIGFSIALLAASVAVVDDAAGRIPNEFTPTSLKRFKHLWRTPEIDYQPTFDFQEVSRATPKAFKRIWRLLRSNREHPEGFTPPIILIEARVPGQKLRTPKFIRSVLAKRTSENSKQTTLPTQDVQHSVPRSRILHIPRLSRWIGLQRHPEFTTRTTASSDFISSRVPKQRYTQLRYRRFTSKPETFIPPATLPEHSVPRAFKLPRLRRWLGLTQHPELTYQTNTTTVPQGLPKRVLKRFTLRRWSGLYSHSEPTYQINTTDVRWSVPRISKTGVKYRVPLSIRMHSDLTTLSLPNPEHNIPRAFNRRSLRLNANIRQHPELSTRTTLPSDYVHSSVPRVTKERTKYRINLNVRQHPETVASFLPSVEHNVPRAFNRRSYKLNLNIRQHPELITQATTTSEFVRFSVPRISKTGVRYRLNLCIRLHPELLVSFVPAVEHNIPKGFKRRSYKLNPNIRQHPELSHQINTTDVQAHVQRRSRLRNYPFQLKPPYRGTTPFAPTPTDAPARVSRRIKYGRLFRFRSSTTPVIPVIVDALSRVSRRIRPNRATYRRPILNAENTQQVNTTTVQSRVFRPRFVYALRQPYHVTFPIGHTLLVPVQVSFVGATPSINVTLATTTPSIEISQNVTPSLSIQLVKATPSTDIEIVSVQASR